MTHIVKNKSYLIKFGILTVSDTCYNKENIDKSGPAIKFLINQKFANESSIIKEEIVPDDFEKIKYVLKKLAKNECDVIFTTGGTGIAERDVTPEATKAIIQKELPGITFAMMQISLQITPFAMLSRAVAGIYNKTIIINFPGSEKAVKEHFLALYKVIPHAVSLLQDDSVEIHKLHHKIQNILIDFVPSKVQLNPVQRSRSSPYKMIEMDETLNIIVRNCLLETKTEVVNINEALGRVLSQVIESKDPIPPFNASIKDGYAVRSADGSGRRLVVDVKAAGDNPHTGELKKGECIRISTGAPVPAGADAVVQVEDTELLKSSDDGTRELDIYIKVAPKCGQDIRMKGSDMAINTRILHKGDVLNAAELGVCASLGMTNVHVYRRLRIGVISTGNEVQDPSLPLQAGHIRDSNKITIINLLKQYNYPAQDFGHAKDEPNMVKKCLENAFDNCELVITTGGVSMGEFDILKQVLVEDFGADIHFGRVNMKPGKPTTFATCIYKNCKKIFFGLPGNPVSATVTCLLFVIPTLRFCENRKIINFPKIFVKPNFKPVFDSERPDYQRVRLIYGDEVTAESTGNQISSRLNSFVGADGIMLVDPYKLKEGETLENNSYHFEGKKYLCYVFNKY